MVRKNDNVVVSRFEIEGEHEFSLLNNFFSDGYIFAPKLVFKNMMIDMSSVPLVTRATTATTCLPVRV